MGTYFLECQGQTLLEGLNTARYHDTHFLGTRKRHHQEARTIEGIVGSHRLESKEQAPSVYLKCMKATTHFLENS